MEQRLLVSADERMRDWPLCSPLDLPFSLSLFLFLPPLFIPIPSACSVPRNQWPNRRPLPLFLSFHKKAQVVGVKVICPRWESGQAQEREEKRGTRGKKNALPFKAYRTKKHSI